LLNLDQTVIDNSENYCTAAHQINQIVSENYKDKRIVSCCWGYLDWLLWEENAKRNNEINPFSALPLIDLMSSCSKLLGICQDTVERGIVRHKLGLKTLPKEHDALVDAKELVSIYTRLLNL
jgi:inhibitor of KinA sporulation pathway (predicted exonuclease)